ncbi:hypothetical protein B0H17DRAFT_1129184 [Mycena rosella]|uniref:Uncharacterized protein n=1 Tax=Mycena rosella TaxID=1033263 RepID=A0AAD7DUB6_MYCRO|nr:hypothetical protein B0H17DRAFT_1129184 [Mycena rosella]
MYNCIERQTHPPFKDTARAVGLYQEAKEKRFHWTLHQKLNIPQCLESFQCQICIAYFDHLEVAQGHGGVRVKERKNLDELEGPPVHGSSDGSDMGSDEESESETEDGGELDLGDSDMDVLFRLRDARGQLRVLHWQTPTDINLQEAGRLAAVGMLENEVEVKWQELQIEHSRVLAQRDQLQARLNQTETHLRAAQEGIKWLSQSSADVNLDRPRKRLKLDLNATSTDAVAGRTEALKDELTQRQISEEELKTQYELALAEISALKQQLNGRSALVPDGHGPNNQQKRPHKSMPGKDDPPKEFARWILSNGISNLPGIPTGSDLDWVVRLDPLPIVVDQQVASQEVAHLLAAQGLTNYLKTSAGSSPNAAGLLRMTETALQKGPPPPGLYLASQDQCVDSKRHERSVNRIPYCMTHSLQAEININPALSRGWNVPFTVLPCSPFTRTDANNVLKKGAKDAVDAAESKCEGKGGNCDKVKSGGRVKASGKSETDRGARARPNPDTRASLERRTSPRETQLSAAPRAAGSCEGE